MTDEEFYRHALNMLQRELGADASRDFLRLPLSGVVTTLGIVADGRRI